MEEFAVILMLVTVGFYGDTPCHIYYIDRQQGSSARHFLVAHLRFPECPQILLDAKLELAFAFAVPVYSKFIYIFIDAPTI
jgi:hypothetical protein